MTPSPEILFALLRAALGKGTAACRVGLDLSSVSGEVWKKVIDLSFDQGVAAIAVDGLQKSLELVHKFVENNSGSLDLTLDSPVLEDLKYEWLGEVFAREDDYWQQMEAIRKLVGLWSAAGLDTYALKGVVFAQYYPVPEHRSSCDFDCNVRHAAGTPAWAEADRIARENGIEVDGSMNKHSRFVVSGLQVENHRSVISVNGSRKDKRFDAYLQSLLDSSERNLLLDLLLYSPGWLFNALFCVAHARTHFLSEDGITLKHVLDWGMIRKASEAGQWREQFESDIDRFGLRKFFDSLDAVTDYVMGAACDLTEPQRLMLEDILAPKDVRHFESRFLAHLNILRMLWVNRWKFRLYSETSFIATIWRYAYGHWFDRDNV